MKENLPNILRNAVFVLIILALGAAILFFLPTTAEFYEFNKFTLVLALLSLGLVFWTTKMILEKRAVFTRTPLDVPILVLVVIFLVSALASIDPAVAFFGKHGRIWPSFFALSTLAALYFLACSNLKTKKHIHIAIWTILVLTLITSVVSLFSYFGFFAPFDFAKIRSFNPIGTANSLALLEALILPIAAFEAVFAKQKVARTAATIVTLIIAASFILVNFLPAYFGLLAALIFLTIGALRQKLSKEQQAAAAILAIFVVLFLVVRFVPQLARGTLYEWIKVKEQGLGEKEQIDTPKENTPVQKAAWEIAFSSIGKKPILGTGEGTYQFVYTQLKPREVNTTDNWAIRFDKSSSEFSEILATTGIVGAFAFLLLIFAALKLAVTLVFKNQHSQVYLPLAASIVGFLVASFFTTFSFATLAVFLIILALLATQVRVNNGSQVFEVTIELSALKNRFAWLPFTSGYQPQIRVEEGAKGAKSQLLPWLLSLIVVAILIPIIWQATNAYRAEYFYRQALLSSRSGDGNKTVNMLQKAIAVNARVDSYHRLLSQTSLNAAINLSRQANLDENQRQLLAQLAQVAIDQGKAASGYQILPLRLPGISAANVANWEALSTVYQALIGSTGGADVHATNTLTQAVALDPQNPILHNRLGQLYQRLGNLDLAQRKYEDAIIVKNDFGPAHYNLANLLIEREGDVGRIVNELTLAKRLLPQDDPAKADIEEKLEKYNEQFRNLQKQTKEAGQITPEEASASPSPSPRPSPSPSPTASPSPSPSF